VLEPVTDARAALRDDAPVPASRSARRSSSAAARTPSCTRTGNLIRHLKIRKGDPRRGRRRRHRRLRGRHAGPGLPRAGGRARRARRGRRHRPLRRRPSGCTSTSSRSAGPWGFRRRRYA
jgi:hypothetical protein